MLFDFFIGHFFIFLQDEVSLCFNLNSQQQGLGFSHVIFRPTLSCYILSFVVTLRSVSSLA